MKRNIIISIEADGIADTTGNAFPTTDPSITKTSKSVSLDSELTTQNQESPDEPITNLGTPLQTDRWIYRIVVSALALTIVSCIGSAVWLQSQDKEIPEILTGLGTGALGGLAGLLAPTPSKD